MWCLRRSQGQLLLRYILRVTTLHTVVKIWHQEQLRLTQQLLLTHHGTQRLKQLPRPHILAFPAPHTTPHRPAMRVLIPPVPSFQHNRQSIHMASEPYPRSHLPGSYSVKGVQIRHMTSSPHCDVSILFHGSCLIALHGLTICRSRKTESTQMTTRTVLRLQKGQTLREASLRRHRKSNGRYPKEMPVTFCFQVHWPLLLYKYCATAQNCRSKDLGNSS
jgi:hypothetical protein